MYMNQSPTLWPCSTLVRTPHRLCSQGSHSSWGSHSALCRGPRMPKTASWHCQLHPAVGVTARCQRITACHAVPLRRAMVTAETNQKAQIWEWPSNAGTLPFSYRKANLDDKIGTRSSLLPVLSSLPEIKQRTSLQAHVGGILKDAISKHHVALLDPWQVQNSPQAKLRDSVTQTQCSWAGTGNRHSTATWLASLPEGWDTSCFNLLL